MSIFWEGFWFVLFTLSNANGSFVVFAAFFTSLGSRFLATITWTTTFRLIFNHKHIFEPILLDLASISVLHLLVASWGMKWAHMVALGLNTVPFIVGYLAPSPNPAREWGWTALLLIYCNFECMMMIFLHVCLSKEGKYDRYDKFYWVCLGWVLIAQSILFHLIHLQLRRKRLIQIMSARIMGAQIAALGRVIPRVRRHAV